MTTIVGMKTFNETWLMVDSCLTIGNMCDFAPLKLLTYDSLEDEVIPSFALACAGALQATQEVFSNLVEILGKATIKPGYDAMDFALVVARASRSILRDAGITLGQSQYLLALPGQLFAFTDAGDVHMPNRGYHAAGTGEAYALGAMGANERQLLMSERLGHESLKDICTLAMNVATDLDLYTKPPFYWARVFVSGTPGSNRVETGMITE